MITQFKLFEKIYTNDDLFASIILGRLADIKEYLTNGGDINIIFNSNENMLSVAARNGYTYIVKYLIKEGIDLDWVDYLNRSVLILLCSTHLNSKSEELVKILIDAGADLNIKDKKNQTALYYAAQNNEMDLVRLLIDTEWSIVSNLNKTFYDVLYKTNQNYIRKTFPEKYNEYMKKIKTKEFNL